MLTILYNEQPVGFAMVRRLAPAAGSGLGAPADAGAPAVSEFSMAEFFIARPWRRRGIGAQAVRLLFDRFNGRWLITEHQRNTGAVEFWRGVVAAYTRRQVSGAHPQR